MSDIGTPQRTADGATIHPGAKVWYHDMDDSTHPASAHLHACTVDLVKAGSVSLSVLSGGYIELGPDRLYADSITCAKAALKVTEAGE